MRCWVNDGQISRAHSQAWPTCAANIHVPLDQGSTWIRLDPLVTTSPTDLLCSKRLQSTRERERGKLEGHSVERIPPKGMRREATQSNEGHLIDDKVWRNNEASYHINRVVWATCSEWVCCEWKTVKIGRLRIPSFMFFRINQGFILSMKMFRLLRKRRQRYFPWVFPQHWFIFFRIDQGFILSIKMFRLLRKRRQRYFPRVFPQHWLILSFHHEYRLSALAGWPRPRSRRKFSLFSQPEQQQHCSCCWIPSSLQIVNRFCVLSDSKGARRASNQARGRGTLFIRPMSVLEPYLWPVLYVQGHSTEIYWCLYCIPECGVSLSFDLLRYRSISPPVCKSGIGKSAHLD